MGLFSRHRRQEELPAAPRLLSYRVGNMQGRGTRERQEDAFAFANALDVTEIRLRGLLAVVADGMGGMEDGKRVSEAAVTELLSAFEGLDRAGSLPDQLRESVLGAGVRLYDRFGGSGGTTLVATIIFEEQLYWASVGDSFLYLLREGGIFRLNRDHNYRAQLLLEAVRRGELDRAEADADPDSPRLTEFLGRDGVKAVDYSRRPLPLRDGDVVFLCSDGVGGVLGEEELRSLLFGCTPEAACARVEGAIRARARSNQDNYTGLVVTCGY